jgi:hypothetical protein
MDNPEQPKFNPIPRSELLKLSLFGNEEARELARRLLPNTPEERDPPHPYFLAEFAPGSQAEADYKNSPVGKLIEQIVSSQPEEGGEGFDFSPTEPPLLPLPADPKPAPVAEEPELGESMAKLVRHPLKPTAPRIQLPQWTKGEPYVGDDFGRPPLDW